MSLSTVGLAPGVYVEELFSLAFSVKSGATAVPVFVGYFLGKDGNPKPVTDGCVRITDWMDFESQFYSGLVKVVMDPALVITKDEVKPREGEGLPEPSPGPYSVNVLESDQLTALLMLRHYFDNGGGACYVLSVADADLTKLKAEIEKFSDITLLVAAVSGNKASTFRSALNNLLGLQYKDKGYFLIAHGTSPTDVARPNPALASDQAAFYTPYLKTPYAYWRSDSAVVVNGYEEDEGGGSSTTAIVDTDETLYLSDLAIRDSELYASIAKYIDKVLADEEVPDLPPSAAVAGAYCRTDRERGVWKAPANVELSAVIGVSERIGDEEHGVLNSDGVNVIRWFDKRGAVIYGARTLAGNDENSNDSWRYIQVRRLFGAAERDIKRAVQAAMFEPNNAPTWESVRVAIDNYLHSLWRQGALMGNTPAEAYFVRIGKGITMTDDDITSGKMIVKIGMAAVRPAEFILLEFTQRVGLG